MASPYDVTVGEGFPYTGGNRAFVLEGLYDATEQELVTTAVAEVINIPANTYVQQVFYKIETGQGAARNFEVGDGDDVDGWVEATSSQTAGDWVMALVAAAYPTALGKLYTDADTIDVRSNGATLDACKIRVKAICFRVA